MLCTNKLRGAPEGLAFNFPYNASVRIGMLIHIAPFLLISCIGIAYGRTELALSKEK